MRMDLRDLFDHYTKKLDTAYETYEFLSNQYEVQCETASWDDLQPLRDRIDYEWKELHKIKKAYEDILSSCDLILNNKTKNLTDKN